jgi:OOP family OmpA-OmpF porin
MIDRSLQENEKPDETVKQTDSQPLDEFAELRDLLLSADREQLAKLKARLEDPQRLAEDVSNILPDSIRLRTGKDKALTNALTPTVEASLNASVKRNPRAIADAIFPVIGPAIRKAISSAMRELVQSINQALEYSLSIKGLRWRLEALRTGKSFAEVVLRHTLLYRVEQIFLIHRETGLLLQHIAAGHAVTQDADMVSGMLTAIQDFVRDSFGARSGEALEALEIGDLQVWTEQGPNAILAAVIRGNAPQEYRTVLQDAIETIHLEQGRALGNFQGDASAFEASRPTLEGCLQMQFEEQKDKKQTSPLLWLLAGAVILAVAVWLIFFLRSQWRWDEYLYQLKAEPGIIVVSQERRGGKYYLTGLRDPLAADPSEILRATGIDPQNVASHWESYHSTYPDFVLQRANEVLRPPQGVSLSFADGILQANGNVPLTWTDEAQRLAKLIAGVNEFRADAFAQAKARIEKTVIRFNLGSAEIPNDQQAVISKLAEDIEAVNQAASISGKGFHLAVFGFTDASGTEALNQRLQQDRAENIIAVLTARGINSNIFSDFKHQPDNQKIDRIVTFKVTLAE